MGIQEVKKLRHRHRHGNGIRVEDGHLRQDGGKEEQVRVLDLPGIALPLHNLRPVKTGRRRLAAAVPAAATAANASEEEEEEEEDVTTPTGEGCRIPAEAATCPPAPKKPRTAVAFVVGRRCNCLDDGEALEFFRVPADLEGVFTSRAAKAN